jgi:hypothetical protein
LKAQAVGISAACSPGCGRATACRSGSTALAPAGIAALTAALEPALSCVIAGMPMVDVMGLVERHVPVFVRDLSERFGISFEAVGRLLRVVSPLAMPSRVTTDRLFIFGGVADRLVPSGQVRALWKHVAHKPVGTQIVALVFVPIIANVLLFVPWGWPDTRSGRLGSGS